MSDSKAKIDSDKHHHQKKVEDFIDSEDDIAHKALVTLVNRKLSTAEELGMVPLNKPVVLKTTTASYIIESVIGCGSFGAVLRGMCDDENKTPIALKRVLQDKRYKNRELQTLKILDNPCVVKLLNSFYSQSTPTSEVFLNVVMDYLPINLHDAVKYYTQRHEQFPTVLAKTFTFQMLRGLCYIHSIGICHRDLKPHNVLCSMDTGELRICDFGSAKVLRPEEPSVAYICSRFYRAPELIFGATVYTTAIDMWSAGCIIAELFLGRPLLTGDTNNKQIQYIMRLLGSPTRDEIKAMNKNYKIPDTLPHIARAPWSKIFRILPEDDALAIIDSLLVYVPSERATAAQLLVNPWFSSLAKHSTKLPNGCPLPPALFDYSKEELDAVSKLELGESATLPIRKHHHKHHKHHKRPVSGMGSPLIEGASGAAASSSSGPDTPTTPVTPEHLLATPFSLDKNAPAPAGATAAAAGIAAVATPPPPATVESPEPKPEDSLPGLSSPDKKHKHRKTKRNLMIVPTNSAVTTTLTTPVQAPSSLFISEKF